jgi:malate/lactate dehydrogenase
VDELTNYLYQKLGSDRDIFGFGIQLDQRRFREYLKKDVVCIGTHGAAIPLMGGSSTEEYSEISEKVDRVLFERVSTQGIPHHVAGEEFKAFFENLSSAQEKIIPVSYLLRNEFRGIQGIAISLPFVMKGGEVIGVQENLHLNEIEIGLLKQQADQIRTSVAHIVESHKYLENYG